MGASFSCQIAMEACLFAVQTRCGRVPYRTC